MDQKVEQDPPGTGEPPPEETVSRAAWVGLFTMALAVTLISLDMSVVTVANPAIAADLDTTLSQLQWVTTGYLLAFAASLVVAGKLGDRFGHRLVFLVGMAAFMASSALVGRAQSVEALIAWRVVQGVAGATLMPSALAILRLTFPPGRLKTAIGVFMGTYAVAGVSGPFVGGAIVELADWRWAFYVNVFVGAAALLAVLLLVRPTPPEGAERAFDMPGIVLLTGTLLALVWSVDRVTEHGWTGVQPLVGLALALLLAVLFVLRERRTDEPVIPLSLFRAPPVIAGTIAVVVAGALMFGSWFYLALYMQHVRGMNAIQAGLGLLPLAAMTIVAGPIAGKLNERFGRRVPLLVGSLAMAVGFFGLAQLSTSSSYHALWPFLILIGGGMSTIYPVATEAIIASAPPSLAGVSSGMSETAASVGPVLGVATIGSIMFVSVDAALPDRLAEAGVPDDVAADIADAGAVVAQGSLPVAPGTPAALAESIVAKAQESFVVGLQTSLTVAAVVTVGVALLTLLIKTEDRTEAATPE
ncbi:MFS transporter [Micromonospora olivasterospora]|uniref:EmrB/QacA subfamily drug resistance transporter n=1 Tax=Micromonospora olivasterospora TaxID=1880 RepID=A0A562I246_MICOL|nr:MFS transporter [Micromonospora olivasterospora]TWH65109.1 EmrB/QacA subfamily drug resistance transporter [Micromonospora olivasterospora]